MFSRVITLATSLGSALKAFGGFLILILNKQLLPPFKTSGSLQDLSALPSRLPSRLPSAPSHQGFLNEQLPSRPSASFLQELPPNNPVKAFIDFAEHTFEARPSADSPASEEEIAKISKFLADTSITPFDIETYLLAQPETEPPFLVDGKLPQPRVTTSEAARKFDVPVFGTDGYARKVLYESPSAVPFQLVLMGWPKGFESSIHSHGMATDCYVKQIAGSVEEKQFAIGNPEENDRSKKMLSKAWWNESPSILQKMAKSAVRRGATSDFGALLDPLQNEIEPGLRTSKSTVLKAGEVGFEAANVTHTSDNIGPHSVRGLTKGVSWTLHVYAPKLKYMIYFFRPAGENEKWTYAIRNISQVDLKEEEKTFKKGLGFY